MLEVASFLGNTDVWG